MILLAIIILLVISSSLVLQNVLAVDGSPGIGLEPSEPIIDEPVTIRCIHLWNHRADILNMTRNSEVFFSEPTTTTEMTFHTDEKILVECIIPNANMIIQYTFTPKASPLTEKILSDTISIIDHITTSKILNVNLFDSIFISDDLTVSHFSVVEPPEEIPEVIPPDTPKITSSGSGRINVDVSALWDGDDKYIKTKDAETPDELSTPKWFDIVSQYLREDKITNEEYYNALQYVLKLD